MAICKLENAPVVKLVESNNNAMAHTQYKATPLSNNFLFSLISITCPAYNAKDTAGITSASPIRPMANGSLVNS